MKYTESFQKLVNYCSENKLYIGTGNPEAKILIIGKECAIDQYKDPCGYCREIVNNCSEWRSNIKNKIQQEDVGSWFDKDPKYNPLYPYKGQKNIQEKRSSKNQKVISGEGGTSATWYWYQRLLSQITGESGSVIDFHKHCFLTELSIATMAYSKGAKYNETAKSIAERLNMVKKTCFFKDFDIIILACGNDYIKEAPICETFCVNNPELTELKKGQWFSVYTSNSKLVIHTRQLSMCSKDLIDGIAEVCKKFAIDNNIEI